MLWQIDSIRRRQWHVTSMKGKINYRQWKLISFIIPTVSKKVGDIVIALVCPSVRYTFLWRQLLSQFLFHEFYFMQYCNIVYVDAQKGFKILVFENRGPRGSSFSPKNYNFYMWPKFILHFLFCAFYFYKVLLDIVYKCKNLISRNRGLQGWILIRKLPISACDLKFSFVFHLMHFISKKYCHT